MSLEWVNRLLKQTENCCLEFKVAKSELPSNLFETICAMLNRSGGNIFLGVNDAGEITGVTENACGKMITDLVNLSNNPQKIDPPFILHPQKHILDGKSIIYIQIPASSQVHKTANAVFDRSDDGDFKIIQPNRIAELYNSKRNYYTENIIYPYLKFEDFKVELFPKIRNLIKSNNPDHPWLALTDIQMLEVAGLWKRDFQTGEEGYTLAAALLLGKDVVIQQIVPHYKTDALVRIKDLNRYDDRLYVQTNLIEAYELLMNFIAKHLPDAFYLRGDQRVSLRTQIFREIIANILVHREYTNAQPCTMVIKKDRIELENANNPHGSGLIDSNNFAPFAKNPSIAKFFIQLGRVDELGSGVLNTSLLVKVYSKKNIKPEFIEGTTFRTIVPLPDLDESKSNETANEMINEGAIDKSEGSILITVGVNEEIEGTIDKTEGTNGKSEGTIDKTEGTNGKTEGTNGKTEGVIKQEITGLGKVLMRKLSIIVVAIATNEGKRVPDYALITSFTEKSIERYLKQLSSTGLIEFKGEANQTGGYYLTPKMKQKLLEANL
ncbi:AAA family ATPase [Flavobacterium sp. ZT3R18]|uniref:RNA-binding domain-containing protein n=1 Tax=Flavobacterium sp. ZT3R18 TaxID=2594429 RepID=UPI00117BDBB4|nr:RNA-binding domain-containing protein [Flavobacterium sp. ZT3R18]TRX34178.1 AAA family ATPase [Flavobacterium sp. ZT3R18]